MTNSFINIGRNVTETMSAAWNVSSEAVGANIGDWGKRSVEALGSATSYISAGASAMCSYLPSAISPACAALTPFIPSLPVVGLVLACGVAFQYRRVSIKAKEELKKNEANNAQKFVALSQEIQNLKISVDQTQKMAARDMAAKTAGMGEEMSKRNQEMDMKIAQIKEEAELKGQEELAKLKTQHLEEQEGLLAMKGQLEKRLSDSESLVRQMAETNTHKDKVVTNEPKKNDTVKPSSTHQSQHGVGSFTDFSEPKKNDTVKPSSTHQSQHGVGFFTDFSKLRVSHSSPLAYSPFMASPFMASPFMASPFMASPFMAYYPGMAIQTWC